MDRGCYVPIAPAPFWFGSRGSIAVDLAQQGSVTICDYGDLARVAFQADEVNEVFVPDYKGSVVAMGSLLDLALLVVRAAAVAAKHARELCELLQG